MRIMIAGGSGFLGRALTGSLISEGHTVLVLSRKPGSRNNVPGLEILQWDAQSSGPWAASLEGCDAVVNFTGENLGAGLWTRRRRAAIRESRQMAGKALVAGFRSVPHRPTIFLQASAIGYYGTSLTKTFKENDPPGKDWLAGVAVDWENSTREIEEMGVRRIIIRTGLVLARHGSLLDRISLPFRFFVGGRLGSGRQWWSWIHLQDEIDAIRFLLKSPTTAGPYNLTAPEPQVNADFSQILGRAIHRPAWIPAPGFALKLALGEMSTLVLDGQRVLPERLQAAGYQFHHPSLPEALEAIYST